MRVLLQRVTSAEVRVSGRVVGAIDSGLRDSGLPVAEGEFGADMQASLVNDGPVTFIINL